MSRGNVFKLSSNQILGGNNDYQNPGIDDIKNSLKLLKAKKNQKQNSQSQGYGYGGTSNQGPPSKNYTPTRNDYNYDMIGKNHLPSSQKDFGNMDYKNDNYNNNYQSYGNKDLGTNQKYKEQKNYDYGNKPATYSHQSNSRNSRNSKNIVPQSKPYQNYNQYDDIPPSKKPPTNSKIGKVQPKKNTYDSYNNYNNNNYQNQYYNQKEQRSIKQVNRDNQVDIVQYDPSSLRQCKMGCGRKFNPDSLSIHQRNCKKVFQKKRKEFNAQQHRLVDKQQPKMMKKGERVEQKIEQQKKNEKLPKWKAQSMAFRAAMMQNRGGQMSNKDMEMVKQAQQAQDNSGIQCKLCGRKFNEQAGQRHIKFCEQQHRKNAMKKKK